MSVEFLDPNHIISSFGYIGIFLIVFAESGLLIGFFLPGDSLLVTAGLIASRNLFGIELFPLILLTSIAAITGDSVGYWFGRKTGRRIFNKPKSILFHRDNMVKAKKFYDKHGGKTIVVARFMPFIRTFAPIVAGIGEMKYSSFLFYNILGGLFWVISTTLLGYFLGNTIPGIDKYIHWIILAIIIISIGPPAFHLFKGRKVEISNFVRGLLWPLTVRKK